MAVDEPGDLLDSRRAGGIVVRGGALRIASYVLGTALTGVSAALVARHLGAGRFGDYQTVLALVAIVATLSDAGVSTLAVREYTQSTGADRDETMRMLLGLRLALSLAGLLAAVGFGIAAGFDGALLAGTVLAGAGMTLTALQAAYAVALQASLRLGTIAALELGRHLLTVLALVALVLASAGVAPLLGVPALVGAVLAVSTAVLARGLIPLRPTLAPRQWAGPLRLVIVFALASAVGTLYVYGDQVLTSLVASERQTGYFGLAFRIFVVVGAVPGLVVSSAFPVLARAARDDQARLAYAVQRLFELALVVGALFAVVLSVGAPLAVAIVGGSDFEPSVAVLRIQGAALLATFLVATWGYALISLHRHRALLVTNGVAFLVSTALTLALAPSQGARGTAIATIAGEFALAGAYLVALVRARPDLRPRWHTAPRVALAAAPPIALVSLVSLGRLGAPLAAGALMSVLLIALRAVPDEVRELVPQLLRSR